ncbi:hypothetical protein SprV_0501960700 [Sparganum proliferum]
MRYRRTPTATTQRISSLQSGGFTARGTAPLLSSDGSTLLKEKCQILKRSAERLRNVLKCPSTVSDAATDRFLLVISNVDLDLPPSLPETIRAVQQISSGKTSGSGAIPAEIYKYGGHRLMDQITTLLQETKHCGKISQDFKYATTVHLYKRKGNRQICNSHRGVSPLNISGTICVRALLNHPNGHLEQGILRKANVVSDDTRHH